MNTSGARLQLAFNQTRIHCTASPSCVWSWPLYEGTDEEAETANGLSTTQALTHARTYEHADGKSHRPVMPPVVYLRGAGAAERNFVLLERAGVERGWVTTRDFSAAWHVARSGLAYVVLCDFTPADGYGRSKTTVLVQRVRAKYNPDALSGLGEVREFAKARRSHGGVQSRPEKHDPKVLNRLQEPGAYVLDVEAVVGMIERALAPPTSSGGDAAALNPEPEGEAQPDE